MGRDYLQQHWFPFPLRLLLFGPQRVEDGHGKDYPSSHVKPCLGWVRIWALTEGWVAAALMVLGPSQILVDQAVHLDSIMCFLFICMYIYIDRIGIILVHGEKNINPTNAYHKK